MILNPTLVNSNICEQRIDPKGEKTSQHRSQPSHACLMTQIGLMPGFIHIKMVLNTMLNILTGTIQENKGSEDNPELMK